MPYANTTEIEDAEKEVKLKQLTRKLTRAAKDAFDEAFDAASKWAPMNSAHEAFAVMHEEFDELKAHVWMNQKRRDIPAMRTEAVQVAAMALRFITDICDSARGLV